MEFLANENFSNPSIDIIRNEGYQVISIRESSSGIADEEVIAFAIKNNLVIVTFDKDYGELIVLYKFINPPSVVYFKSKGNEPKSAGFRLLQYIQDNIILENHFTIIEDKNIRQRKYK